MLDALSTLFADAGFMPHGHCYLWLPSLVWTHVTTDMLIGIAYLSISLTLYRLIRQINLPFSAMVLSFGVFIGACGATHFMEVWNLWYADYWAAGFVKFVTAAASVAAAVWLIKLKPQIMAVAASAALAERRRDELEATNKQLQSRTDELLQTNRVLAEEQRLLAQTARMSALGEMASGIAHEINSPLGIITIHAHQLERLLKRDALTPEVLVQESRLIATTAKRIGEIIKGLRAFAREGEKDPFERVFVAGIIREALVLCQTRFKNHDVALRMSDIREDLAIECRSVQIGQVILNLLLNAFDATEQAAQKWVRICLEDADSYVRVVVEDSGPGIAAEVQGKIMQPFFTTKEVGRGTGLGLSISKGIVESHAGKLEFDGTGAHTRFVVTLPKRQGERDVDAS